MKELALGLIETISGADVTVPEKRGVDTKWRGMVARGRPNVSIWYPLLFSACLSFQGLALGILFLAFPRTCCE